MDKNGALSKQEKGKVTQWLSEKSREGFACQVCNASQFAVADHAVTPIGVNPDGVNIGGANYPQVMAICTNCGNTLYFNGLLIGLFEHKDGKDKE